MQGLAHAAHLSTAVSNVNTPSDWLMQALCGVDDMVLLTDEYSLRLSIESVVNRGRH